eukprot:8041406-Pyramimonas_sp.AAC.1
MKQDAPATSTATPQCNSRILGRPSHTHFESTRIQVRLHQLFDIHCCFNWFMCSVSELLSGVLKPGLFTDLALDSCKPMCNPIGPGMFLHRVCLTHSLRSVVFRHSCSAQPCNVCTSTMATG